jgi:hypothetical protein
VNLVDKKAKKILFFLGVAAILLACGISTPRERPVLYPSPTQNSTQTPIVIQITNTPENTSTPVLITIVQTTTPIPTSSNRLCVIADQALNLRTQPSMEEGSNGSPLPHGAEVLLTGTKNGEWLFVKYGDRSGWVYSNWLGECNS